MPSVSPQFPPAVEAPQVPTDAPFGIVHWPAQQSEPVEQISPTCPQYDPGWQLPPEQ
jgi:hypothetical protein